MRSLTNTLVENVITLIDNKILSLRVISELPESVKNLLENRLLYYDYAHWQKKMYYCQAELQTGNAHDHWSSWMVYYNVSGHREFYDEITIQVDPTSDPIEITPHENYNKWRAYREFADYDNDLHEYEVEEFIDDYDY
jgi:hypothetical protein